MLQKRIDMLNKKLFEKSQELLMEQQKSENTQLILETEARRREAQLIAQNSQRIELL